MFFAYNADKITYVKASTEENFNFERGQQGEDDLTYTVNFGKYEPFAGFAGYVEGNQVTALGFFRYMCAERPEDLDYDIIIDDETNTDGNGTGTDEGAASGTGDDTPTSTTDDQTDQNGNQSSSGEG